MGEMLDDGWDALFDLYNSVMMSLKVLLRVSKMGDLMSDGQKVVVWVDY
jgi:hypothetical protein